MPCIGAIYNSNLFFTVLEAESQTRDLGKVVYPLSCFRETPSSFIVFSHGKEWAAKSLLPLLIGD